MGSFREQYPLACFDPEKGKDSSWSLATVADGARRERAYYMITAPHMPVLQSHVMLKSVGPGEMKISSTGEIVRVANSSRDFALRGGAFRQEPGRGEHLQAAGVGGLLCDCGTAWAV